MRTVICFTIKLIMKGTILFALIALAGTALASDRLTDEGDCSACQADFDGDAMEAACLEILPCINYWLDLELDCVNCFCDTVIGGIFNYPQYCEQIDEYPLHEVKNTKRIK